jgi:hypothetical protein
MPNLQEHYDVVVCGGGLAGFCAAVAAARNGARTCLIQDRPVFGGNSSSEIRVTPAGAATFHAYARETGVLSELFIEERARNHEPIAGNGWTNSIVDMVLYEMAMATPSLTFHLNTTVTDVQKTDKRTIQSVRCRVANAQTQITIHGKIFLDCTGDSVVADLAGCQWRMGSEGRDEFDEPHAPQNPSDDVMGSSLLFKAKDMHRPVPFTPPPWAARYEDAGFFYDQGRVPRDVRCGYWWIEIGVPWHTIHDTETIRHELTRHVLGVWDWIKNRDPNLKEKAANFALDWIGQVPGKRESRRVIGQYLMTEHDVLARTVFPDEVAFGGWFVDLHTPGGLLAPTSEPASAEGYQPTSDYAVTTYCGPYGIPLRACIAKDLDNLLMAGRNVSVTHAALGTVRVMGTTALMGQAAGTAAAVALRRSLPLHQVPEKAIADVQQTLLRDGCFLPNYKNEDPADLARAATASASSQALLHGAGPSSPNFLHGINLPFEQARRTDRHHLQHRRGQWIAVAADRLDSIAVCLTNLSPTTQNVPAKLLPVEHIWDYRVEPGPPLAEATLQVPPGKFQWITWPLHLDAAAGLKPGRYLRLDLLANPNVIWHPAATIEPGHCAAFQISADRMRRYDRGLTASFRLDPPQPCYAPQNVLSGVTRPHAFTNLWRSDPAQPLSQWLQLQWPTPQHIRTVQLTFPGHLLWEYHLYQPFYRDPQSARDYCLEAFLDGRWKELLRVEDNYQCLRRHVLDPTVTTDRLRVVIHATNGDPSSALYEIRCYAD